MRTVSREQITDPGLEIDTVTKIRIDEPCEIVRIVRDVVEEQSKLAIEVGLKNKRTPSHRETDLRTPLADGVDIRVCRDEKCGIGEEGAGSSGEKPSKGEEEDVAILGKKPSKGLSSITSPST